MDWNKNAEEMMKAWSDTQSKMWEAFAESAGGFGKSPGQKMWDQYIANGEELIKNTISTQTEWFKAWAANFESIEGMPEQAGESLTQFKEMTQQWADTQEKLWGAWFSFLKKFDPNQFSGAWGESVQNPYQIWQDTTKRAMDAQMDWMKTWMSQFTPAQEE